jgi:hypothetical protein
MLAITKELYLHEVETINIDLVDGARARYWYSRERYLY